MRILFLSHYFPPEGNAPASRTFENQHQVALLDGKLVVIGNRGTVLQSARFVAELEAPRLYRPGEVWGGSDPQGEAVVEPEADALQLLQLGQLAQAADLAGPWEPVLPLYPTSPVEGL